LENFPIGKSSKSSYGKATQCAAAAEHSDATALNCVAAAQQRDVLRGQGSAMWCTATARFSNVQRRRGVVLHPIHHLVEVLSRDKPKFHETLLSSLTGILDLVPAFNLTNNMELTRLATTARETLGGITVDQLRSDPDMRKKTLQDAQALLATFGSFSGRRIL